jgi:phosphoribosyl 1,2-cyclic phosphodiesterase
MQFIPHHSGSSGNLYQVVNSKGSLIIDAGVPIRKIKQAFNFNLRSIDGALISHQHTDHLSGVRDLARAGINCFMSAETAEGTNIPDHHRINVIEPLKQFRIAGWTALGFPTQHDCPGSLGYLVTDGTDKLLFATDTFYIHHRFQGLTILAIECNWSKRTLSPGLDPERKKRLYRSHMNLERCKQFLQANDLSKVREVHLIHMSRENSNADLFVKEIEALTGKPVYAAR